MAATPPLSDKSSAVAPASATVIDVQDSDPFRSAGPTHHRFSTFNAQLFALGPNASPAQAKRALEAHLAETDRRMEEAGKLGTALVQQRSELTERLREVEKLQAEDELSDDLRQKLTEIEKDYNEVARESARAFLPKSRVPSNEAVVGSPFVPEGKGGKRSVSPSKFEAQATASPTKLNVPNRKIRNQPSNRIHDIEFAAEISTSLIAQVRNLQGLLAEKDEELKEIRSENSKLEYEVEGFTQRLKSLDDSEHRYKDENWNLETQLHELMAKEREAADREKKLTQTLNMLQSEKNASQRELDEIKLSHAKLAEEHAAAVKHHDIELGTAKRSMVMAESERAAMQRKIEDLTGQNTELAKAMSVSIRAKKSERESIVGMSDEDFQTAHDNTTPEQSPPASPVKGTPRHSMLESETLKTSLAHAQRLIQSLRTNIHREKTDKMESKRLLQEARDEIEKLRSDPTVSNRRARKTDSREFKKPPRLLGGLRSARSEIFVDDSSWEDTADVLPHPRSSPISRETTMLFDPVPEHTDHFETANETSDAAFETANENATETDDFHTGAEEFSSDDVETETESPLKRRTLAGRPPNLFGLQRNKSIDSTASTEDEDFPYEDVKTPTHLPPLHAKFPLRVSRGAFRRSRHASEEPTLQSSPASFATSSNMGTPQQPAQSLAAELGDFDGSDNESNMSATPSKRSIRGRAMTPPPALPPLPRVIMVDSSTMTEPMYESSTVVKGVNGAGRPVSMNTVVSRFSMGSEYSDSVTHDLHEKLAEFPTPPTTSPRKDTTFSPSLVFSTMHSHDVEPLPEPDTYGAEMAALRTQHAEQLKTLTAENGSAHATAIEILKSQHNDELNAAQKAHAQEIESLRSHHTDATNDAVAAAEAAHAHEIESIKLSHADQISEAAANARASHEQELESLRTLHSQQSAQKESENQAAHDSALAALKSSHAEELSRRESESAAAHAAAVEALKAAHGEELARRESEIKAAHDADIESLKSAHAEEISRKESELKAAAAAELEAVKLSHAHELSNFKSETETLHATELAALAANHTSTTDAVKKELSEAHARELEVLKSSYADQNDQIKQSMDSAHSEQLENLKTSHLQHIDDMKASIHALHAAELESLRTTHAQHILDAKNEIDTAHAAAITSLTDSHNKQLDDTKRSLEELHSQELESLKTAHSQELGSLNATHNSQINDLEEQKDATHAAAISALVESQNKRISELQDKMSAIHAKELEQFKASHHEKLEELGNEKDAAHAVALAAILETHAKQLESQKADNEATMSREIIALKALHAQDIEALNSQYAAAHAKELDGFKAALEKQIDSSKTEGDAARTQQIEALNAAHTEIIEAHKRDAEIAQTQALEALKSSHERQIDTLKSEHASARTSELDLVASKHLEELNTLKIGNAASRTEELQVLTDKHLSELKSLKDEHETSKSQHLEELRTSHLAELEALRQELETTHLSSRDALRQELDVAHAAAIESLSAKHAEELEALRQELEAGRESLRSEMDANHIKAIELLNAKHAEDLETLREELQASHLTDRGEYNATHVKAIEALTSKHEADMKALEAIHLSDREAVRQEIEATHSKAIASLGSKHAEDLEALRQELETTHLNGREALRHEMDATHIKDIESINAQHTADLETLKTGHQSMMTQKLQELADNSSQGIVDLQQEHEKTKAEEIAALSASHAQILDALKASHEADLAQRIQTVTESYSLELEKLRQQSESDRSRELAEITAKHHSDLETTKSELELVRQRELAELESAHATALTSLRAEHQAVLEQGLKNLEVQHLEALNAAKNKGDARQSEVLEALKVGHSQQLDQLRVESDATLARELDTLKAQHAQILHSQAEESNARHLQHLEALRTEHARSTEAALIQRDGVLTAHHKHIFDAEIYNLRAAHAAELEALRTSLTIVQPVLGYSSISSIQTEPTELPEIKSPRRDAFIIPRDGEPATPHSRPNGGLDKQSKDRGTPIIAEDDTRQSPSALRPETPDSERPFKEITTNTDARSSRKPATNTSHQSSQTLLTAEGLDLLMKNRHQQSEGVDTSFDEATAATPSTVRVRRLSTDSTGSVVRAKHRAPESTNIATSEPYPPRRPGSSASVRSSAQNRPPLPQNHREVIEAARSHSSHGAKGSMGPPLLPASTYRPSSSRPHTPNNRPPISPSSVIKGTTTPRAGKTPGYADVQSPTRMPMRSRQSSISSFASEIDNRFNIHNGMGIDPSGFGPSTDPRMIQAVTQTMIGEYLWKYTRKTGRGEMSENRHRRFFWVHPYTRALYWSDSDPAGGSRGEMKAKSVPIEAVRVVADDNPMPPGLHRKSLVVIAPGRTIKFTCTTGQRHETWFNALSYLLLRSGNESKQDVEEVAGNITQEDVDEFNPPIHRRPANGQRPRPPPSLSSYNSRTTRNESPNLDTMSIPTLTPTHEKGTARTGTFGRLSGYWKAGSLSRGTTFSSLRSRSYQPYDNAIYEASEVPDSAEDLRQIIEQQDRESDRLENVRACCDGKHDVGTLSHTSKRGRLPNFQTHSHPGPSSGTQITTGSARSRA
ncbi:hypothetical protein F5Y03DRAFT_398776 [Xylaria venustula]|nr:hypothetical protein F5Y03DRAFT_398776 [Xylaria venustula]